MSAVVGRASPDDGFSAPSLDDPELLHLRLDAWIVHRCWQDDPFQVIDLEEFLQSALALMYLHVRNKRVDVLVGLEREAAFSGRRFSGGSFWTARGAVAGGSGRVRFLAA